MLQESLSPSVIECRDIRVRGRVQGVGFRPFVWQIACRIGLAGEVSNDGEGVCIVVQGAADRIDRFIAALGAENPPLALVEDIEQQVRPRANFEGNGFRIVPSAEGISRTGIAPDAATCPDCLAEVLEPSERRHGYALTNCTHCGPRLSIIASVPYDRASTTMADFPMCGACEEEYRDPRDRRFHAQPIACPDCGPQLKLVGEGGTADDPVAAAVRLLKAGQIVAVKGLGGYQLACLASNEGAVAELRRRKVRDAKPFAVMVPDLEVASELCVLSSEAREHLRGPAAPIALLPVRDDAAVSISVAPGLDRLGIMLPNTPLHHLLMRAVGQPLVMTSGNMSDEPQAIDDCEARNRLAGLADAWLVHDRRILNRLDDSVMTFDRRGPMILRRARGMAPASIMLPGDLDCGKSVLAMGGDLKSTFCLLRGREATLSQHIGDLTDPAALGDYREMLALYRNLFDFSPDLIVTDNHPDYLSARLGKALGEELGVPVVSVGHHHAHMAACLAEHGMARDTLALGIVCDGLGMGEDGTLWGGEVMSGGYASARRIAALPAVPLAGGMLAMKQPWRNLFSHLFASFGDEWGEIAPAMVAKMPGETACSLLQQAIEKGINSPACSSAGRLFDAVAAALDIFPDSISHEGQAAMALEAIARPALSRAEAYPFTTSRDADGIERLVLAPMWHAIVDDIARGEERSLIAARFHLTFAAAMAELVLVHSPQAGTPVALSGGVLQNAIVREALADALQRAGQHPLCHFKVPAGDGGLSLGQAASAAAGIVNGEMAC